MRNGILLVGLALAGLSCASTQLGREDRAVQVAPAEHFWRTATPEDLQGRFRASAIEGPIAAVLREVDYLFEPGRFTGSALVQTQQLDYQVLSGAWRFEGEDLILGDGAPAVAEVDGDWLRLSSSEGTVLMRRVQPEEVQP